MRVCRKTFKSLAAVWTFIQHGPIIHIAMAVIHLSVAKSEGVGEGLAGRLVGGPTALQSSPTVLEFLWPTTSIVFIHGLGLGLREERVPFRSCF